MKQIQIWSQFINHHISYPMQDKIGELPPKVRSQVSSILWTRYNGGYNLQRPI